MKNLKKANLKSIFNHIYKNVKTQLINSIVNSILYSACVPTIIRSRILDIWCKGQIKGYIHPHCYIESNKLFLGKGSFLNVGCRIINSLSYVKIGDNCSIGYNVSFITTTHQIATPQKRAGKAYGKPIIIEDGCWIGANSTILPGVTIKSGTIIAAGSVVVRDCDSDSMYAGIPAKTKKNIV